MTAPRERSRRARRWQLGAGWIWSRPAGDELDLCFERCREPLQEPVAPRHLFGEIAALVRHELFHVDPVDVVVAEDLLIVARQRDPRPPLVRLNEIAPRLATQLVLAYAAGLRQQL